MGREALSADAYSGTVMFSKTQQHDDTVPLDPMIGIELADAFRIERVLGEGAMGCLYEASHLRLDRHFAVKVLHQPLAQRDDLRARFDREARVMSRVRSDHVVDVIDVARAPDGRVCIITELLEGLDLEKHLEARAGKLPVPEAVSIARQCLRGLAAAHSLGVVHRDLKPSNLFLARDASGRTTLKILDFGVAKNGGDAELTAAGTIMGTPAYMAPEQARGARFADARSDLYAVGAVLYRALTGRAPFDGDDAHETLIRLMQETPERPSALERSIPAGLEAMIERAMARDPAQRFQTVEEFDRALAAYDREDRDVPAATVSANMGALETRARIVRPLAVASAVLVSLALAGVVVSVLALLVDNFSRATRLNDSELLLVSLGGAVSLLAMLTTTVRALATAWRNAAAVQQLSRELAQVGVSFFGAFGCLELSATVVSTLFARRPTELNATFACLRILLATAFALTVWMRTRARRTTSSSISTL